MRDKAEPYVFDFERPGVYGLAVDFVIWTEGQNRRLLPRRAHLADQSHRAATSIALNVAEGGGEFSTPEKARFYRIAKRSATGCAAILTLLTRIGAIDGEAACEGRELLRQIVSLPRRPSL
jgi:four helix bundle protein